MGLQAPLVANRVKSALKPAVCAIWKPALAVANICVSSDAMV